MVDAVTPYEDGDIWDDQDANWVAGFGDGTDGAFSESASATTNVARGSPLQYTSFLLGVNHTLSAAGTSTSPVIILVQGNVTINGTVSLSGKGNAVSASYGTVIGKAAAGTVAGIRNEFANYQHGNKSILLNGTSGFGGAGATDSGGGGGASSQASGTASSSGAGPTTGAQGACGGTLTFGASSSIDTSGADGGAGTADNAGGGGGGGAGDIVIIHRGAKTDSGLATDVTAGAGGAKDGTGVAGGNGAAGKVNIVDWATVGF